MERNNMWNYLTVVPLMGMYLCHLPLASSQCPRDRCRTVRKVVEQDIKPLYKAQDLPIPDGCPLSSNRDMYSLQEANIFEDSNSKWICQFCGKAFYEPRFLDNHFDNRHPDKVNWEADRTCLADYCDVFRCDVLSGKHQPRYWDKALCRERDLHKSQKRCSQLVQACIPKHFDSTLQEKFTSQLNEMLCDYLSCDRYWEVPETELNPVKTAVYIISSLFLMFGLFVYYYIVYTHFYTDESLLAPTPYDRRHRGRNRNHLQWQQDVRFRSGLQGIN